ncbi:MAG: tRNA (adenine-N1)-methyltransferase [Spirochaetes bacterium]|nr:tRNA (adenine-N1)-methyltransferase [Spirochaetota bacterium]
MNNIDPNEFIYLYNSENANYFLKYIPGLNFTCHKGNFIFPENLKWGEIITTNKGYKFFVLKPGIIEFSMKVKRKNTIIYPKEASRIIFELSIFPGKQVVEIGTGSGAFTYILSKYVGKEGMVYTYEKDKEFLENAINNLKKYDLDFNNIIFHNTDASKEQIIEKNIDAVFVDIPEPWTVVENVYNCLKPGCPAGFLSPCIEQVQKCVEKMYEIGFRNIKTLELFERYLRVKKDMTRPLEHMIGHTAYLYFGYKITI